MTDFEGALAREEGIFARNDAGELIRIEDVTEDHLFERVVLFVDGKEVVVPLALPMLDELGTPLREADGRYRPRRTTLYDAISISSFREQHPDEPYPIPAAGRRVEPAPTDCNRVPILCHQHHLTPIGVCRICAVNVVGPNTDRVVASCITPVTLRSNSVNVYTTCPINTSWELDTACELAAPCTRDDPCDRCRQKKIGKHVRMLLTLLAANHLHTHDTGPKFRNELLELCQKFGVVTDPIVVQAVDRRISLPLLDEIGFHRAKQYPKPNDTRPRSTGRRTTEGVGQRNSEDDAIPVPNRWDQPPYHDPSSLIIHVDRNDCILCDRCVRSCSEVKPFKVIGHTGFGKVAGITFGLNVPMVSQPGAARPELANHPSGCVSCGECATACPTGALEFKRQVYKPEGRPSIVLELGFQYFPQFQPDITNDPFELPSPQAPGQTTPVPTTSEVGTPDLLDHACSTKRVADLFRTIPKAYLWWTEGAVHELDTDGKAVILCRQGDYGSVAFILVEGKTGVYTDALTANIGKSNHRKIKHIKTFSTDDSDGPQVIILGEMACMTHQPRTATLIAHPEARVWVVRRNMLHVLQRGWFGHNLLADMYRQRAIQIFFSRGEFFEGLDSSLSDAAARFLRPYATTGSSVGETLASTHIPQNPGTLGTSDNIDKETFASIIRQIVPHQAICDLAEAVEQLSKQTNQKPDLQVDIDQLIGVVHNLRSWVIASTPHGRTMGWLDPLAKMPGATDVLARLRAAREQYDKICVENRRNTIELLQYRAKQVIVRQDDVADSFFVMYMGHVQVSVTNTNVYPHQSRIVGDHGPSGHFGETALLSELFPGITAEFEVKPGRRTATVTALDHVEVVRIGFGVFRDLLNALPALHSTLEARALYWLRQNRAPKPASTERHNQFLSGQGLYQGKDLLVIDLNKCTRCNECVKACAGAHEDGVTRLILEGNRLDQFLIPSACRSCHDPSCLYGCPVDAIHRGTSDREPALSDLHKQARDFAIRITNDCIGCGLCAYNCPFGSIHMVPTDILPKQLRAITKKQERIATNCDLCHTLDGTPRCVHHCPHDAAKRKDATDFARQLGIPTSLVNHQSQRSGS